VSTLRWLVVFSLILTAIEAFATASLRRRPWVGWLVGHLRARRDHRDRLGMGLRARADLGARWAGVPLRQPDHLRRRPAIVLACYMIFSGVTLLMLSLAVRRLTTTISTALNG
jgi:hypothetical protein